MEAAKIGPDLSLWPAVHVEREQNNGCHTTEEFPLFCSQGGVGGVGGEPTPGARFSKVPVTFQIQNQVFKSNLKKTNAVPS